MEHLGEEIEAVAGREMTLMYQWFEREGYHVDIGALRQEHPNLMTFDLSGQGGIGYAYDSVTSPGYSQVLHESLNLFTYRDLRRWLENPFGTPPLVPLTEQLSLELN